MPPRISTQLYCYRSEPSLHETLKMLQQAGYRHVEGYGGNFADVPALKAELAEHGMTMPTAHVGLDQIERDPEGVIAMARDVGIETVFAPWIPPEMRPTSEAGWSEFGDRLVTAGRPLINAGLGYGWHNHDFELADLGGGRTAMDVLAEKGLHFELDLGWVARAGHAPVAWLDRLSGHVKAVHLKDLSGLDAEDGWADVGHGSQDWGAIRSALDRHGIDTWVIEHDNPADLTRFATRSLRSVEAW